jgi:Leucine-rich repeat (LRR) protein
MSYLAALDIAKTLDHLTIVNIGLKVVPEDVWKQSAHVSSLTLSHNYLDNLSENLELMQNLTCMDVSHNKLNKLPSAMTTLVHLVSIDLSFNYISDLNENIGVLEQLTSLRAHSCKIKRLPESICKIEFLKRIEMTGNSLGSLPENMSKLYQLELLTFDPSELGSSYGGEEFDKSVKKAHIPAEVALKGNEAIKTHMARMREARTTGSLSLKNLGLRNIPEDVWTLSFLTDLSLTSNRFFEISPSIKNLEFLKTLSLNFCPEALYLPPELSLCTRLTSISAKFSPNMIIPCQPIANSAKDTLIYMKQIFDAPITKILDYTNVNEDYTIESFTGLPFEILRHKLTSITVLKLPESSIDDVGVQEFTVLKNLSDLALLDMKLTKLPHCVFSASTHITSLDLSGNNLGHIDHHIGGLRHILELRLIQCQLTKISGEIGRCTTLQSLVLTDNLLSTLPDQIGNLEDLDFLVLDRNFFEGLPSSIRRLSTLTELSLVRNQLKLLPWELAELTQLEILTFTGNPDCLLPPTKYRKAPLPEIMNILFSVNSSKSSKFFSLNETNLDSTSFGELCTFISEITDLNIAFNEVEEFPLRAKLLTSLTRINISNNQFEELNFTRRVIVLESAEDIKEKELKIKLAKAVEKVLRLDMKDEDDFSSIKKSKRAQSRIHSADLEVHVNNADNDENKSDSSDLDEDELAELRLELSKHSMLKKSIRFMSNQMLKIWISLKGIKTLGKRNELLEAQHQRSEAKRSMFDAMVQAELDRKGKKKAPESIQTNSILQKMDAKDKGIEAVAKKKRLEKRRLQREMQRQEEEFNRVQMELKATLVQYEDISFAFFVNLVELDCSNNYITALPHDIFVLTKLKKLDAHSNQLRHLPVGFPGLISLRECKLSENQLMDVPVGLEKMTSLEKMSLDQNEIWEFSTDFGLFESSFKILDLANNRIGRKLGSMPVLAFIKGLRLDGNSIEKFPKAMLIGQMIQLQRLSMSNNTIEFIPETLTTLSKLKYLDLSFNFVSICLNRIFLNMFAFDMSLQLEDVPRFLCRMTSLTDMRFSNCRLQNVAVELCRLKSLTNLSLNGNDFILFPPVECVASGFARVMTLLKVWQILSSQIKYTF